MGLLFQIFIHRDQFLQHWCGDQNLKKTNLFLPHTTEKPSTYSIWIIVETSLPTYVKLQEFLVDEQHFELVNTD